MAASDSEEKRIEEARVLIEDKKKLNLGCGIDIREEYVNIDIQPFAGVEITTDAMDLWFVEDESIDYVVAQHLLEYIPRPLMVKTLKEWYRIICVDGVLEVRVTDVGLLTKALYLNQVSKEMGMHDEMAISLLYGKQLDEHDTRYNGFTSALLQGILLGVGFQVIGAVYEDHDAIISAKRPGA